MLAGGEGTRLHSLTRDDAGNAVPKQFCSLSGRESLLAQTLSRARAIVDRERVTAIVSAHHTQHWRSPLQELPAENIFVQPDNRGTAIGILLPLLAIVARDPAARVLILPSDHYVADEAAMEIALRTALALIVCQPRGIALLGLDPDEPDPELGYIVAEPRAGLAFQGVHRFVEKPTLAAARQLCDEGALWNSFILACRAESLIDLYMSRCPEIVALLRAVDPRDHKALADAYGRMPQLDFSRQIATGAEDRLAVVRVPRCGWSDLGTPERLAQTLVRYPKLITRNSELECEWPPEELINLAERLVERYPDYL
ncbi:MAG: sugar phosphate nucleotidyltransferase [Steroidobacteraceae bacterium]